MRQSFNNLCSEYNNRNTAKYIAIFFDHLVVLGRSDNKTELKPDKILPAVWTGDRLGSGFGLELGENVLNRVGLYPLLLSACLLVLHILFAPIRERKKNISLRGQSREIFIVSSSIRIRIRA